MKDYAKSVEKMIPFMVVLILGMIAWEMWKQDWHAVLELTSYFFFGVVLVWMYRRWR